MLLGNHSVINKSPAKFFAWTSSSNVRSNFSTNGSLRGIYSNETIPDQWWLPVGYNGWMLPQRAWYVVGFSENQITTTGNAVMGVNWDGQIDITFIATADLSLVVSATGECTISITGTGDAVWALYAIGSCNIDVSTIWTLGAIVFGNGQSSITINATANISALGFMTGTMSPFTELSPQGLAQAIWNSIASEYDNPSTMGSKLNTASSWWVDINALAEAVWTHTIRSLTVNWWLTPEQEIALNNTLKKDDMFLNTGKIIMPL